jgi:hypothetical protein
MLSRVLASKRLLYLLHGIYGRTVMNLSSKIKPPPWPGENYDSEATCCSTNIELSRRWFNPF